MLSNKNTKNANFLFIVDIFSSAHDELALIKERICFSDLAAETQDIICAENPSF